MKLRSKEPMYRFLGWNISNGTLQTNWKPETQVLQAKEETREESMAVSNPAPGNKLIIMCLFH